MFPMFEPTIRPQTCWVTTWLIVAAGLISEGRTALAQSIVNFDFTKAQDVQGWQPTHDVARLLGTSEGLLIEISGAKVTLTEPLAQMGEQAELVPRR